MSLSGLFISCSKLHFPLERQAKCLIFFLQLLILGNSLFKNYLFIYLAVPYFSCSTLGFQSSLQHLGSLVAACELLVAVCGIYFPNQDQTQTSCFGTAESQLLDRQEVPGSSIKSTHRWVYISFWELFECHNELMHFHWFIVWFHWLFNSLQ